MIGKLEIWTPFLENPFCNKNNQLNFYDMSYLNDFILVFEDIKGSNLYVFRYDNLKKDAVISFHFSPLLSRSDFDQLVINFVEDRKEMGVPLLPYEPTFFKTLNSSWIEWYDGIFPARVVLNPEVEHHVYVTSEFCIEVMSEQEPDVSVMDKEEWKKIRISLLP